MNKICVSKVGYIESHFEDTARSNWSGRDCRPMHWAAWYPANDDAVEQPIFIGPAQTPLYLMGNVACDVALKIAESRFPVVLLSHGFGGAVTSLGWLAEALARHGFVVIGVNHHGNTVMDASPEGAICWWERPRDLSVALDYLQSEGCFADRLDLSLVFATGFSLGGHTAVSLLGGISDMPLFYDWIHSRASTIDDQLAHLEEHVATLIANSATFRASWERQAVSYADPRVRAALVCAPGAAVRSFVPSSLAKIQAPVDILVGDADLEAPAEQCAYWLQDHLPSSQLTLYTPNVGHGVFLAEGTEFGRNLRPTLWSDAPGVDRRAIHAAIAERALHLFAVASK